MTREEIARAAIENVKAAAERLGAAVAAEQAMEDLRPLIKREAILRIMQTENDLTKKPHSASSAEAIVEADSTYLTHRNDQSQAVVATHTARGEYYAARLTAELEVALVREEVPMTSSVVSNPVAT